MTLSTETGTELLCGQCAAIHVTEGMVPATCRLCIPPRHPVCAVCWPYPGDPCVCGLIHA